MMVTLALSLAGSSNSAPAGEEVDSQGTQREDEGDSKFLSVREMELPDVGKRQHHNETIRDDVRDGVSIEELIGVDTATEMIRRHGVHGVEASQKARGGEHWKMVTPSCTLVSTRMRERYRLFGEGDV
jgi:hypothetical protein